MTTLDAGPCADFADIDDVRGCPDCADDAVVPDAAITWALPVATRLMYLALGKKFQGACTVTNARPCGCGSCSGPAQHMGWATILWPGTTCAGSCTGQCGCTTVPTIDLDRYPLRSIEEVKVDGVVLAPSAYRIDDWRWLRRVDGTGWPVCQNMRLDDTEAGTFSVSFTWGNAPTPLVVAGTAELACEFAKARAGGACRLPDRASSVARQGMTVELVDVDGILEGRTGVHMADLAIAHENPDGTHGGSGFYNPDDFGPSYSRHNT